MILTYRYRLLPLKSQHRALERICDGQRVLYNAALQERIDCYSKTGKTRTYIDQCKALTQCRSELPDMGELPVTGRERTAAPSARAVSLQARHKPPQKGALAGSKTTPQNRGHVQHLAASAPGLALGRLT